MDLTTKQMSILTYSLHTDIQGKKYSFPELIELIFGQEVWLKAKVDYNLNEKTQNSYVDADTSVKQNRMFYTPGFKACLEFMMEEIENEVNQYDSPMIEKEQLFRILYNCGINIEPPDVRKLNCFIASFDMKRNESFTVQEFFHDVGVGEYCKLPKKNLRDQFKNSMVIQEANKKINQSYYSVEDLISLMRGLNLHWEYVLIKYDGVNEDTKNSQLALETMFYAMRLMRKDIGAAVEDKPMRFISKD